MGWKWAGQSLVKPLYLPAFLLFFIFGGFVRSDEGMWLLNDPPKDLLAKRHGFELTQAWLDKARLASIRLNSGGSG